MVGALAFAIAIASASQDIAIDAYAVEVLRKEEQGAAVGARLAFYRAAMLVSGGAAITLAARIGWPAVNALLALVFVLMVALTWRSPEPEVQPTPPRTLRDAVWLPLVGMLRRHRALEILAFVVLYKLGDQLTQSLTRPFLIDMGYDADPSRHRAGDAVGGGHGRSARSSAGSSRRWRASATRSGSSASCRSSRTLATSCSRCWTGRNLVAMYGATGFEVFTSGLGMGAFGVLLLRLTEKRFSATQYALFSSLFALPRVVAGPITGFTVSAVGWPAFFLLTMVLGVRD